MSVQFFSRIPQVIARAEREISEINEHAAKQIADEAATRAPRASGALAASIAARRAEGDDWEVTVGAFYAHMVELGTVRAGARPFLTPAAESQRAAHRKAVKRLYR